MSAKLDQSNPVFGMAKPKEALPDAPQLGVAVLQGFHEAVFVYLKSRNLDGLMVLLALMAGSIESATRGAIAARKGASHQDILKAMAAE